MGYSQSSLAVRGQSPDSVLQTLGLVRTGDSESSPESPFVAAILSSGWFLIVANQAEHDIISADILHQLSSSCEAVTCSVEEHVMVSEASGWRGGERVWRVAHDAQASIDHLEVDGELPVAFAAIRERMSALQQDAGGENADTDYYFDIPVELAMSFTGYRHDGGASHSAPAFDILQSTRPTRKGVLRRLFGS